MDNAAVIDVFSFFPPSDFSQGQKTRGAEVFLLLVCEWVGGVPRGEGTRIEVNAGESFCFSYTYVMGPTEPSRCRGYIFVFGRVLELEISALELV